MSANDLDQLLVEATDGRLRAVTYLNWDIHNVDVRISNAKEAQTELGERSEQLAREIADLEKDRLALLAAVETIAG